MKKTRKILGIFIVIVLLLCAVSPVFAINTNMENEYTSSEEKIYCKATIDDDFAGNRILVVLKNNESLKLKSYSSDNFFNINCKSVESLTTATDKKAKSQIDDFLKNSLDIKEANTSFIKHETDDFKSVDLKTYRRVICIELEENNKENVLEVIKTLEKRDDVLYAGPDYFIYLNSDSELEKITLQYKDGLWGNDAINLSEALNEYSSTDKVTVGVLDSGIDATHPALAEIIDNDLSMDFTQGDNGTVWDSFFDESGHGTHVAGIIAAKGNNAPMQGVCPNVNLVSLRVFYGKSKSGLSSFVARAINYANENNIPILNFSGSWRIARNSSENAYDVALKEIIRNYYGLFICAAGNNFYDNDRIEFYPANYDLPNLISVAASDYNNEKANFSQFGKRNVDLFAPGKYILSTYPEYFCAENQNEDPLYHHSYGYHRDSGTSMATPYVTGVAALLLSQYPELNASQLKTTIMCNVRKVSALTDLCETGGILDAYAALMNPISDHRIHSYAYTTHGLHGGHTKYCTECDYSINSEHKFILYGNTSLDHVIACECGERSDTETHTLIDNGCEYLNETSHNIIKKCEECDMNVRTVAEDHTFESGVCSKCNYTCKHPFAHLNNGTCKLCGHDVSANCSHEEFQVAGYTNFNDFFHRTINECKKCRLLQDGHNVYHVYNFTTDEESQEDIAFCSECGHKCLHTNKEVEFEYCVDEVIESEDYYTLVYSDQYHMKNIFCNACQGVYYVKEAHNHTSPGNIEDMCSICGISHNSSFVEEIPKNALDCPYCSQHKYITVTEEEYFAIMGELPGEPGTEYERILLCLNCHYSEISPFPNPPSVIYVDCAYLGNPMLPYFPDGGIVYWELPDAPEWYPYPSYVSVSTVNFSTGAKFTWTAGVSGARGEFSLASYFFNTDLPTGVYGVYIYMHSDVPAWADIQTNTVTFRYVSD